VRECGCSCMCAGACARARVRGWWVGVRARVCVGGVGVRAHARALAGWVVRRTRVMQLLLLRELPQSVRVRACSAIISTRRVALRAPSQVQDCSATPATGPAVLSVAGVGAYNRLPGCALG